jgi:hypothetical protein
MKTIHYLILTCIITVYCLQGQNKESEKMEQTQTVFNELIHETSPYLLQHAHNPVNWYPGRKAFQKKAKEENKPVIMLVMLPVTGVM